MLLTPKHPLPHRPARRGFTLIEILGVVVILGIAAAIIVPQISSRDDLKAGSAAGVVVSDLLYAQNRAITTQKTHYITFDTGAQTYRIWDSYSPLTQIKHPVSGQNFAVTFGSSSTQGLKEMQLFSASFDTKTALAFDAMGIPYSVDMSTGAMSALSSGTVVIKAGQKQSTVNVAPFSGELTIQ